MEQAGEIFMPRRERRVFSFPGRSKSTRRWEKLELKVRKFSEEEKLVHEVTMVV